MWRENEEVLDVLTKDEVARLRAMHRPNPLLIRIIRAVGVLKGSLKANANWRNCKDMLGSSTLRMELMLFNVATVAPDRLRTVRRILTHPKPLDAMAVLRISPVAVALFEWLRKVLGSTRAPRAVARAEAAPSERAASGTVLRQCVSATPDTVDAPCTESAPSPDVPLEDRGEQELVELAEEAALRRKALEAKLAQFWDG